MPINLKKILKQTFRLKTFTVILTVAAIAINGFYFFVSVMVKLSRPEKIMEPGTQFSYFQKKLDGVHEVGYLTNKDMSEENNDGEFLQAQYMLAPTILRLNETDPNLNILDYANPLFTVFTMKRLKAKPEASSPYSKVLVKTIL